MRDLCFFMRSALFCLATIGTSFAAAPALQYRTIAGPSELWVFSSDGILAYSVESGAVRRVVLDETAETDSIVDVWQDESNVLWVSASSGLYSLDLAAGTREKVPFVADQFTPGKITADYDYVWMASGHTLWQFDKLGREWFSYEIPSSGTQGVLGLYSDEDNVYCITASGAEAFSVLDEKWVSYPLSTGKIAPGAALRVDSDALVFVYGSTVQRFIY
ncbi:MAG: hypothetical protein GF418_02515, partial [Chitinivibrionales bacterium]|nr:hypothetical protein [Chitinivibrionales bacterium]MBD3394475.1 hypothetical protein [Chitinivibrionales bacterium]